MKYQSLFAIFEKAAKFEIVVCCKLWVALYGLKYLERLKIQERYQKIKSLNMRPNKKSVFQVTVLKILDRVGKHVFFLIIFFLDFFFIILCILKGILPFKMHKIISIQKT